MARRIAVVGAGLAGLACAQRLHRAGLVVTVFDKGRRPGGRVSTRRAGAMQFEHGARYVTAGTPAFQASLSASGARAAAWPADSPEPRWAGVPSMSALPQAMVDSGIGSVLAAAHVLFLHRYGQGWHVRHTAAAAVHPGRVAPEGGELSGPYDAVVLAVPAPQAAGLLRGMGHAFANAVAAVSMTPCWAYMAGFEDTHPGPDRPPCDGVVLDWVSRDSARPGRGPGPECWTSHASGAWSLAHAGDDPATALPLLQAAFADAAGINSAPSYSAVHRWRYAFVASPLGASCLSGPDGLALCGDWCMGPGAEAAFLSGQAAAGAILDGEAQSAV